MKKYLKDVCGAMVTMTLSALAVLYQPRLLEAIQKDLLKENTSKVVSDSIWIIGLGIIAIVAGILNVYFAAKLAQGVTSDLREEVYEKIQSFSYANIDTFSTGSLTTRLISDMNQIMNLVMSIFMQLVRLPIILVGSFILAILTIPRFWWITLWVLVILTVVGLFIMKLANQQFEQYQVRLDKVANLAQENLLGMRVVKSFNQEGEQVNKFSAASDDLNRLNLNIGYLMSAVIPAFSIIAYIAICAVTTMIGLQIKLHPTDIAVISPYVNYILTLLFAVWIIGIALMNVSRGKVSLGRIKEVLDTKPSIVFNDKAPDEVLSGDVEFNDVSFTYPGSTKPTLQHISFNVHAGEIVGIVGATGSGKSTLAQLIARLYDPSSGTIKIGGRNLKEISEKSLRKSVAFVLQKAILFSGTIASNLRQGKVDASKAELERASIISQSFEFVRNYQDGFNHEVQERSANFSGGQKQRLSIARGIISNSPILILDDSTSALDAESEKKVQDALEHKLKETTTFLIAEKIISIKNANRILVLDDGKLVAQGTHEELLKTSDIYQEILKTQQAREMRGEH
ncbi:ABC transporter ATPase and permease component [Lactobacillus jensenii DSM 20557]|nr:ABC transporter ATPase and permease component [Lactobacillus jensenii DSM 20557]